MEDINCFPLGICIGTILSWLATKDDEDGIYLLNILG
jgi:hypothetical protein